MTDYILTYYQAITDGSITVGRWIRDWYTYIIEGLEKKAFFFDAKKADKAIRFIETFCRHHEGDLAPGLITLELWQKAMISVIFGVVDETGARQFREVFVEIGRKNGKTMLAAAIIALVIFTDPDYGKRAYVASTKLEQSRLCYDATYQMIQKEPDMTCECRKRRTDIYIESSNSSIMPLGFSERKSDGLNPSIAVCDEISSWKGDPGLKQYEVLKSAMGARRQPILLSISTAGYVDDGIFDELKKRATQVIRGTSNEMRLAPFLYEIDDIDKWNDLNELKKANPNLGVSISVNYMLEEIAVAEQSRSKRVEFLTKYCNVKMASSLAWIDTKTIRKSFNIGPKTPDMFTGWQLKMMQEGKINEDGNHFTLEDFSRCSGLGGIDLSQTVDLTACTLLVQRGGVVYYFTQFFLPRAKIEEATARDGIPYEKYIEKGWLKVSGENMVDFNDCYQWFVDLHRKYKIYVLQIGIDRYCAQYLQASLEKYGFHCDTVFQGRNLTGVINTTEGMLKDGLLQCANENDLMKIHWMDAALKLEPERNMKSLVKLKKNAHVDGVAALLDGMCMRANVWERYKQRLVNEARE